MEGSQLNKKGKLWRCNGCKNKIQKLKSEGLDPEDKMEGWHMEKIYCVAQKCKTLEMIQ